MYYNPGGLAFCENMNIGFMYSELWTVLYTGKQYIYIGGTTPVPIGIGNLGIGYTYFDVGELLWMDNNSNEIKNWEMYDYALTLSYGQKIFKNLGIGISLKYIYSLLIPDWIYWQFAHEHGGDAKTLAFDGGILYKTPLPSLSIGISCQNLGFEELKYDKNGTFNVPIPSLVRTGIGFNALSLFKKQLPHFISDLNFSADLLRDLVGEKHENWYSWGTEIIFKNKFSIRSGYSGNKYGCCTVGITYGCGITVGAFQIDIANDISIICGNWKIQINFKPLHLMKKKENGND